MKAWDYSMTHRYQELQKDLKIIQKLSTEKKKRQWMKTNIEQKSNLKPIIVCPSMNTFMY